MQAWMTTHYGSLFPFYSSSISLHHSSFIENIQMLWRNTLKALFHIPLTQFTHLMAINDPCSNRFHTWYLMALGVYFSQDVYVPSEWRVEKVRWIRYDLFCSIYLMGQSLNIKWYTTQSMYMWWLITDYPGKPISQHVSIHQAKMANFCPDHWIMCLMIQCEDTVQEFSHVRRFLNVCEKTPTKDKSFDLIFI